MQTIPNDVPRRPLPAVTLSLIAPGLGQIYCGRLARGLGIFFCSFAFGPLLVTTASHAPSTPALTAAIASIVLMVLLFVYAAIDAFFLARKAPCPYEPKEYNRWYVYLLFIAFSLFYPVSLANTIKNDIIQAYKIPSDSMEPTIRRGDFVLLNKITYTRQSPAKGDVVIFNYINDRRLHYMKRIVAMPGDTVEMRDNTLWINDQPVDRPASAAGAAKAGGDGTVLLTETSGGLAYPVRIPATGPGLSFPKTLVPNGFCFVLGDNRGQSRDSREFGPVPLADVRGRVEYIYYPASDWSRFGRMPR